MRKIAIILIIAAFLIVSGIAVLTQVSLEISQNALARYLDNHPTHDFRPDLFLIPKTDEGESLVVTGRLERAKNTQAVEEILIRNKLAFVRISSCEESGFRTVEVKKDLAPGGERISHTILNAEKLLQEYVGEKLKVSGIGFKDGKICAKYMVIETD